MKAYICNKCGKATTDKKQMENMNCLKFSTEKTGTYCELHLCDACSKEFFDDIRNGKAKSKRTMRDKILEGKRTWKKIKL